MAERTENEERPELEQLRVLHQALQQEDPVQQELAHYQRHACASPEKNTQDQGMDNFDLVHSRSKYINILKYLYWQDA